MQNRDFVAVTLWRAAGQTVRCDDVCAVIPVDCEAPWVRLTAGTQLWGFVHRDKLANQELTRADCAAALPLGSYNVAAWAPDLWPWRDGMGLAPNTDLLAAERGLLAFLEALHRPSDEAPHTAAHVLGFCLCLLVVKLVSRLRARPEEWERRLEPETGFLRGVRQINSDMWQTLQDCLRRKVRAWTLHLTTTGTLRWYTEECLCLLPAALRQQVRVVSQAAPAPLVAAFPDTHRWVLAPFELVPRSVASRRAVLYGGLAMGPKRLLLPDLLVTVTDGLLQRLLATDGPLPPCRGALRERLPAWWKLVARALDYAPQPAPSARVEELRERPPCLVSAMNNPRRLPYDARALLWPALLRVGETAASLQAKFLPGLRVSCKNNHAEAQRLTGEYTKEWYGWEKRVRADLTHGGPSCVSFAKHALCPLRGGAAECNGPAFVLRDIEDLGGELPQGFARQPVRMAQRRAAALKVSQAMNQFH